MNLLTVWALILAVRLLSVFLVQTYYVPDEYWQSLEVAHRMTFGYGYLTWEWTAGIRSYIYPVFIAGLYKILVLLGLETAQFLILVPRLAQALLSAYSDYRFFVWSGKHKWALFLILVPWFWFYMSSRTLSNTLETSLTTIALSFYPWERHVESTSYIWLAALCCFLRPTAAIIWLPLCLFHLQKSAKSFLKLLFTRFLPISVLVGAACIAIDSHCHGRLIITPFEFLKYNVFNNIGAFYGAHPWYWYFTVGLPTVLGINLLPFAYATYETIRQPEVRPIRVKLLVTILVALLPLSVMAHKEFRFVAPLLPLCLYISADMLTNWSRKASRPWLWATALLLLAGNALPAWYLSSVHQQGPLQLMSKLRDIARDYRDEKGARPASIFFLMPCHSTPYYSHVHENVTMRFLTCEPNLHNQPDYKDEAEQFYEAPSHWLRSHIPSYPRHATPSHIVLFEPLTRLINDFLLNYKLIHRLKHAEYIDGRKGKHILVYQRLREDEPTNVYNRDVKDNVDEAVVGQRLYPDLKKHMEDSKLKNDEIYNEGSEPNLQNLYN